MKKLLFSLFTLSTLLLNSCINIEIGGINPLVPNIEKPSPGEPNNGKVEKPKAFSIKVGALDTIPPKSLIETITDNGSVAQIKKYNPIAIMIQFNDQIDLTSLNAGIYASCNNKPLALTYIPVPAQFIPASSLNKVFYYAAYDLPSYSNCSIAISDSVLSVDRLKNSESIKIEFKIIQ